MTTTAAVCGMEVYGAGCAGVGSPSPEWAALVSGVQAREPWALERLYGVIESGARAAIRRQVLPQDVTDKVHDLFISLAESLREGKLREPDRFPGYLWAAVRGQMAKYVHRAGRARRTHVPIEGGLSVEGTDSTPEQRMIEHQRSEVALRVLKSMSARDREVLLRFYLREQNQDAICAEMGLTEGQFRTIKTRAKSRFGEMGRRLASDTDAPSAAVDAPTIADTLPIGDRLTLCEMRPRDWRLFDDSLPRLPDCNAFQQDLRWFSAGRGWCTRDGAPSGESGRNYHRRVLEGIASGPYQAGPFRVVRSGDGIAFIITPQYAEQRRIRRRRAA